MNAGQLRLMVLGAAVALGFGGTAEARSHGGGHDGGHVASHREFGGLSHGHHGTEISFSTGRFGEGRHGRSEFASRDLGLFGRHRGGRFERRAYAYGGHSGGGIQCVTFARSDSGIELSGNANTWWDNAQGVYQRGSRPEAGSVLNFRANGSMRMGHVAVVNQVVDNRTIEIDHANWGGPGAIPGGISRDISVVDVSPTNDWSAVRVALGHSGEYGSIYPTYGFIYNRPDHGTMVAANDAASPIPAMNPAPRDLRGGMRDVSYDEVAEAPDSAEPVFSHHGLPGHHRHRALTTSSHHRSHGRY